MIYVDRIMERNFEEAVIATKEMDESGIVDYCRKRVTKLGCSDRACRRWEIIRDNLLSRLDKKEKCKFKVGTKVHWVKSDGTIDYTRIDEVISLEFTMNEDIYIKTLEICSDKQPRRGVAYKEEYLVLA